MLGGVQTETTRSERASQDNRARMLERAMARHHYSGDALLEVLHTAQELYGYLTPELLRTIAQKLKLPPSHVYGVVTFYHFFSLAPRGEHTATVCLGTACYVKGALDLLSVLEHRCAKAGSTSPDGKVSVATARCVGACGLAPVLVWDGEILGRVSPEKLNQLLDQVGVKAAHDDRGSV